MAVLICPKCRKRSAGSKTLGGGWQGTSKVVGCPECRTFFRHSPYMEVLGIILGLVDLVFVAPYVLYQALVVDLGSNARLWNGLFALAIGAWLVLGNRYLFKKNVRGEAPIYTPPWERA
jgi:hypothetical protein